MNIALLHYSAPPTVGGVESVIAHHAKLMANAGHEVRIVAGTGEVFDRRIQFVSVPLIASRHTAVIDAKIELDKGNVPKGFPRLVSEIKNKLTPILEKVDLLIAHNVCSLHKNMGLTVAIHELSQQAEAPKIILWHHDLAWTSERYKGELHSGYPWDLLRTAWPGVKQVAISESRRKEIADLQSVPAEEIEVIPNGLDIGEMMKLGSIARSLVEKLGLLAHAPLLLLPVRITKRKNIELALRSVAELRKQLPHAQLVVTGPLGAHNPANREYFEDLKTLKIKNNLNESVHFLAEHVDGFLPDEAIYDLYRVTDALFLPSFEEGFGIPILEAGLTGIPIFCSDIPSLKALAGEDAHFFSLNADPALIASLISSALTSNAIYRQRVRVRQNYTWQAIFKNQISPMIEGLNAS